MNDLGKDSVGKLLFRLAVPAITAQIINALYNVVDRIYIGRIPGVGSAALTGVGVAFPILMIISAFSVMVGMGGAPRASIEMGKGDYPKAEKIMTNALALLLFLGIVLMSGFLLVRNPLLSAFGASNTTLPYGSDYLAIYLLGTVFVMISVGMNSFITSQGFAKEGMATVLIGAVLNILLDPLFIFVFHMGVKGAALASVLSQGVSALWAIGFLTGKKTILHFHKKYFRPDFAIIGSILALGISPFIMQSTESLVNIVLNTTLQRYGGDIAVGSMTILTSVVQFSLLPLSGLAQGAQPIISYNFGAGHTDRVRHGVRLLVFCGFTFATLYCLACELFPQVFVGIFTTDPELLAVAPKYLRIYMAGTWFMGAQIACQNSFIALGEAKISLFLALLRKIILLIPLIYLLSSFWGTTGVFVAQPIADILAAGTTVTIFTIQFKKIMHGMNRRASV